MTLTPFRAKFQAPMPLQVNANAPLSLTKSGGIWTAGVSFAPLAALPTPITSPNTKQVLIYDATLGSFFFTTVDAITGAGGSVTVSGNNAWTGTNSFLDNNFSLLDNLDNTKAMKFQLAGFTTGTTRTFTPPNGDTTLVGTDSNQILINKNVVFNAGTTATAPFSFASGTNLTTPAAGAFEYDGKVAYFTPNASNRAVNVCQHFLMLNTAANGVDSAAAQTWFPGGGSTGITLPGTTTFFFEGWFVYIKSAGTVAHTVSILFGGTATFTSFVYNSFSIMRPGSGVINAGAVDAGFNFSTTAYQVNGTSSSSASEAFWCYVKGIARVNAGGTLLPQFQWSAAPGGTPNVQAGTWFALYPIGTNPINSVGNWS